MENNTNVKSLAAMFNVVPSAMEDTENSTGQPGLKGIQARRAGFEKVSNPAPGAKKPAFPKPVQGLKSASEDVKPSFVRPVGSKIGGSFHLPNQETQGKPTFPKPPSFKPPDHHKEESKPLFPKPIGSKPFVTTNSPQEPKFGGVKSSFSPQAKENEEKPVFRKPSEVKAFSSASESEAKPTFNNRPQLGAKPPANIGAFSGENNFKPHNLATKTFSSSLDNKLVTRTKESPEENESPAPSSQAFPGVKLKPVGVKPLQSRFLEQNTGEQNDRTKPNVATKEFPPKTTQNGSTPAPFMSTFPRGHSMSQVSAAQDNLKEQKDPSEPKRKPLPHLATLGPPPAKPPRPPNVDIERFRGGKGNVGGKMAVSEQKSSALSSALPPPPPPGNPNKSPAAPPQVPGLPPRHIMPLPEPTNLIEEETYDDIGPIHNDIREESDGECYEGIDEQREEQEKNDKKRKKEQKEKEKKEQEIRKRFKLSDKIEVLHQARACVDYKGGKNELSFKNGDQIEVIRLTDNPEGKWLGRMKGNYGYIKTMMVNIDYDSLKRKQSTMSRPIKVENDQDFYDDVGEQDSISNHSIGGNSFFPPPPSPDDEIYDGIEEDPSDSSVPQEEEKSSSWSSWGLFKKLKGTEQKKKNAQDKGEHEDSEESDFVNLSHSSIHESDVYDDVDSKEDFPPPPPDTNSNTLGKSSDYKTLKRLEKEEKEFRKKFKYTGEIRTLSLVQVKHNLTTKKWGSKDLALKPGETLDLIQNTNDTILLCKNSEGKYGYVLRNNLIDTDGEIYDDVGGGDCIYDND
ncbi:FYN-binding protein 1 isoform X2 [Mixophyes fleayi]|uniref:FYN-binding protein 1 isoform X2 n=1 Tax=Mixophyes fleayi TaxID=3061075 RepID=UPI003F4D8956